MNRKLIYSLFLFFTYCVLQAQVMLQGLVKGGCTIFKGGLFCYGLVNQRQATMLRIYKMDKRLKKTDSIQVTLPKTNIENYLLLYSDTLHNYLNIYLQQKQEKTVSILRFNSVPELLAKIENTDIARLNSKAMFGSETFYYKTSVYSILTHHDSLQIQFFLNRHELKSEKENFDYSFKWQFPFERKHVRSARIFYADNNNVLLLVTVSSGNKAGYWMLKINAATGQLIKGTRLNGKDDHAHYPFSVYLTNSGNKSFQLIGQKFNAPQLDYQGGRLNMAGLPTVSIYYIDIDSIGEVTSRKEFKIPITETGSGAKKTNAAYLFRIVKATKQDNGRIALETDIYKSVGSPFCYSFAGSEVYYLLPYEERLMLEKNTINSHPQIEQFTFSADKLDLNGKLCVDSLEQFSQLYYKTPALPVKQAFKTDELNNTHWLLTKSNIKKNTITYATLAPVKNLYELKTAEEITKNANPQLHVLSSTSFLISYESEEGLRIKIYNW